MLLDEFHFYACCHYIWNFVEHLQRMWVALSHSTHYVTQRHCNLMQYYWTDSIISTACIELFLASSINNHNTLLYSFPIWPLICTRHEIFARINRSLLNPNKTSLVRFRPNQNQAGFNTKNWMNYRIPTPKKIM